MHSPTRHTPWPPSHLLPASSQHEQQSFLHHCHLKIRQALIACIKSRLYKGQDTLTLCKDHRNCFQRWSKISHLIYPPIIYARAHMLQTDFLIQASISHTPRTCIIISSSTLHWSLSPSTSCPTCPSRPFEEGTYLSWFTPPLRGLGAGSLYARHVVRYGTPRLGYKLTAPKVKRPVCFEGTAATMCTTRTGRLPKQPTQRPARPTRI